MDGQKVRIGAGLLAEDVEIMVRFYRDVLGFRTDWDGGNFAEFETGSGKTTLVLYSSPARGINSSFDFGIRNFYVADPEGNLLEIGSMNAAEG